MTFCRIFSLGLALSVLPLAPVAAQDGGRPSPPSVGAPGWQTPQPGPPPACQKLLVNRDETQKHGQALQVAGRKKASPEEICQLFKAFLVAETGMLEGLEAQKATCGVPANVIDQVKAQHGKASQMADRVCAEAVPGTPLRFYAPAPQCAEKTLKPGVPCVY